MMTAMVVIDRRQNIPRAQSVFPTVFPALRTISPFLNPVYSGCTSLYAVYVVDFD